MHACIYIYIYIYTCECMHLCMFGRRCSAGFWLGLASLTRRPCRRSDIVVTEFCAITGNTIIIRQISFKDIIRFQLSSLSELLSYWRFHKIKSYSMKSTWGRLSINLWSYPWNGHEVRFGSDRGTTVGGSQSRRLLLRLCVLLHVLSARHHRCQKSPWSTCFELTTVISLYILGC
jgi:hypothetical protein